LPGSSWISNGFDYYPLLRKELLIDFQVLPRLLNKITSRLSPTDFSNLVKKVTAGKKARNAAKDILKEKGLI
jgi:glycine betaine/choline ABC-type transport system substrate-binding protein